MAQKNGIYSIKVERVDFYPFHLSPNLRLLYILDGGVKLRFTCGEHLLKVGEIEIINMDEPVQMKNACVGQDNLILLFEFDGAKAKQFNSAIVRGIYNCNSTLFYSSRTLPVDQQILKRKLRLIYRYYINGDNDFLIDKTIEEIVMFICERCHDLKNMFHNAAEGDPRGQRFLRVYTYMLENFEKKINLKKLAEQEYVSPQYLSKEFNDKLGINFKDTLEYFRVIQSVRYLITGNMAVTQICQRCGFSALRYFYKHFSFYLDCTPLEFRNACLSQPEKIRMFPVNYGPIETIFQAFEDQEEAEGGESGSQSVEHILQQAIRQAVESRLFKSRRSFCILRLLKKESAAELGDRLAGFCQSVGAESLFVFCIKDFSSWDRDTAMTAACCAAAAERFCQTAAQAGLKTAEAICNPADVSQIVQLLGLSHRVEPVLLAAAGRAEPAAIQEKERTK